MATYYIKPAGDGGSDAADGLSSATAWATIEKALATISASGGHVVNVAAGTYRESSGSGYLSLRGNYTALVRFVASGTVTITGTTSANYNVLQGDVIANQRWEGFTFGCSAAGKHCVTLYNKNVSSLEFLNCTFSGVTGAVRGYALYYLSGANCTVGVTCTRCTFTNPSTDTESKAIYFNVNNSTNIVVSAIFNHCSSSSSGAGYSAVFLGVSSCRIVSGTWVSAARPGLCVGMDGPTGVAGTSTIENASITGSASHGLVVGAGQLNTVVRGCRITGADYGLVIKQAHGTLAYANVIIGGTNCGVMFKGDGATAGNRVINNYVEAAAGYCVRNWDGAATDYENTGSAFYGNVCVNTGTARGSIVKKVKDLGGTSYNNNVYVNVSDDVVGEFFDAADTQTNATSIAAMATGWATIDAGYAANDASSIKATSADIDASKLPLANGNCDTGKGKPAQLPLGTPDLLGRPLLGVDMPIGAVFPQRGRSGNLLRPVARLASE